MYKIIWISFLICWIISFSKAQQKPRDYFLLDQKPVYVEKVQNEALLILKSNTKKLRKQSPELSKMIQKYSHQSLNQSTYHHLNFDIRDAKALHSFQNLRSQENNIQAIYPAYKMQGEKVFLTQELILKINPEENILTLHLILNKYDASITELSKDQEGLLYLIKVPDADQVFDLIHELDLLSNVIFVEPDWVMMSPGGYYKPENIQIQNQFNQNNPDDPLYPLQWFLHQNSDVDIDAPEAWGIQEGDSNVVVAVIDLHGFDLNHIDLKDNIIRPFNAVTGNSYPEPQNEYARHGTPCAGLVGAVTNNQIGISSIGGKVKVMPILIGEGVRPDGLTYVRSSSYLRAAEHIIKTPQVVAVSNSFAASNLTATLRYSYERMQNEARDGLGAVVLASSGNWNRRNQVIYPYYLPGVIGVGATRNNDTRAGFSNYGDSLDIVVPGEGIYTTLNDSQYGYFGGTSASCPIASGLVGLMASQQPNLTAKQLGRLLMQSCDKINNYSFENMEAYPLGSWNEEVGYGRVNAGNALQMVLALNPPMAPEITFAEAISNHEIRLNWQDTSQDSDFFILERTLSGQEGFISIANLNADSTGYRDTSVEENTQYTYRVQAGNQDGFSAYSEETTILTPGKPTAPKNLSADLNINQNVILNWDFPSGNGQIDAWLIHRYINQGQGLINDTTIILATDTTGNQFIDTHLSIPGWYVYDIQASNQYGVSLASNQINIAPGAIAISNQTIVSCQELLLDTGGEANYGNNQQVICQLSPAEAGKRIELNFLEFDLEFGRDSLKIYNGHRIHPDHLIGGFTGGDIPSAIKSTQEDGTISLLFQSDHSVTRPGWQALMRCVSYPPIAPVNLRVDSLGETSLQLYWDDLADNENGFEIWRTSLGNPFIKVFTTQANDTSYIDENLKPGIFYTYKVRALNDGGMSGFSNLSSAGTLPLNIAINGFWTKKADLQSLQGAVGFAIDDKGFVLSPDGTLWEYDSKQGAEGQWIEKSSFPGGGRYNAVAMVIRGKAYVGLGFFQDDFWQYDPLTDTWTAFDHYPEGFERYQLIGFAIGDKGYAGIGDSEKDLWQFDPDASSGQQWTRMNDMPEEASRRFFPVAFSIGSKGYITTGFYSNYLGDLWEFDPFNEEGGSWIRKADIPLARAEAVAFSIADKGYVGTGSNRQRLRDFWEYDPRTDQWQQKADFGGSIRALGYAMSIHSKGYLGGGTGGIDFWAYQPAQIPEAPENPDALQVYTNQHLDTVYLSWNDNSMDEVGFEIWRSEDHPDNFSLLTLVNTESNSYTDSNVQLGRAYYYQVRAFNFIGASVFSNQDSVVLLPQPPAAPSNLEATAIDDSSILLNWEDQSNNEDNYLIFRWNNEEGVFEKLAELPTNTNVYRDQELLANASYRYKVQASNLGGISNFSNEASATTLSSLPPIPEMLSAVAIASHEIQLTWEDWSSIADKYELYRFDENTAVFSLWAEIRGTENSFLDANLESGTSYTYKIRAYNEAGYSAFSPEVSTYTFFESPTPPANLTAEAFSSSQIRLNWEDRSDNEQYFILETLEDGVFVVLDTLMADETSFIHQNLAEATTHHYRIKAINEFGSFGHNNLGYSNQANATTWTIIFQELFDIPDNIQIAPVGDQSLQISWMSNLKEEQVFEIFRAENTSEIFEKVAESDSLVWLDTQLRANTWYNYKIRVSSGPYASDFSDSSGGLTLPARPQNFQADVKDMPLVSLSWSSENNPLLPFLYILEKSTDTTNFKTWVELPQDQVTYQDTISQKDKYYYRIRAYNSAGYSAYSSIVMLDFSDNSGNTADEDLEIKPNPVQEVLQVDFEQSKYGRVQVKVFNSKGKLILNEAIEKDTIKINFDIQVGNLTKGNYILRLELGNQVWSKRFVKN